MWIGGNDLAEENTWVWANGSPVNGNLWGSPSDSGNCMLLTDYQWYERECEGPLWANRAFLAMEGISEICEVSQTMKKKLFS